jgi:diketogulonate reductase-like aldo/keto reductase
LVDLLRQFGEAHGGKTPSQAALNWLICKGALPIPGAHSVKHVQENAGALGWRLSDEEVARLDAAEESLHRR